MPINKEIILFNISGQDKCGITATLTGVISQQDINIHDIGQALIHQNLVLVILFEVIGL